MEELGFTLTQKLYRGDGLAIIPLQETLVQIGATVTVDEEKQLIVAGDGNVFGVCTDEMKMANDGQVVEIDVRKISKNQRPNLSPSLYPS
ncbi:hypothetical protein KHA80_12730 [Anaerobacillus sp. HL2]|nr:hypothetical protein KHA80_12730 [Anaerobacillus sp. HL2]